MHHGMESVSSASLSLRYASVYIVGSPALLNNYLLINSKSLSTRVYLHKNDKKDLSMSFPSMDLQHLTNPFYRVSNVTPGLSSLFSEILKNEDGKEASRHKT